MVRNGEKMVFAGFWRRWAYATLPRLSRFEQAYYTTVRTHPPIPVIRSHVFTVSTPTKKMTKNTTYSVRSSHEKARPFQPLRSMIRRTTQKTAVASTAARKATQIGRNAFTQPARVLGWPAAGHRARAAGT